MMRPTVPVSLTPAMCPGNMDTVSERTRETEMTSTADFGAVTNYQTGEFVRKATAAEWRRTAEQVSIENVHQGFWRDEDGTVVYVDGGPEAYVTNDAIRALRDAAGSAGDLAQVALCDRALEFADTDELVPADDYAWDECARVIISTRMEMA